MLTNDTNQAIIMKTLDSARKKLNTPKATPDYKSVLLDLISGMEMIAKQCLDNVDEC